MRVLLGMFLPLLLAACGGLEGDCNAAFAPGWTLGTGDTGTGSMVVKNNSQWCGIGITSQIAGMDGKLVMEPDHGTARVLRMNDKVVVGYLPAPGYEGDDRFKVLITPGYAHLLIKVTVLP